MELAEAIILSVLAASTPLLIAATGELVTERAGVLNLGVEGMMIVGAACGFGGAWLTGSTIIGALCGMAAGTLLSLIFALPCESVQVRGAFGVPNTRRTGSPVSGCTVSTASLIDCNSSNCSPAEPSASANAAR